MRQRTRSGHHLRAIPRLALLAGLSGTFLSGTMAAEGFSPDDAGSGMLLRRSAEGLVPLPAAELRIDLRVTGVMLYGRIEQAFLNPTDEVIDAVYVFPLPDGAAVHRMEMRIGERRIVSEVRERARARATYEAAREQGRKAALVEQDFGALFTTSAANINPGETVSIVLEYVEEVEWSDGAFGFRFPLAYTPRYTPPIAGFEARHDAPVRESLRSRAALVRGPAPTSGGSLPRAHIDVAIEAGVPLARVSSPSHALDASVDGTHARVRPAGGVVVADRDFVLRWQPATAREPRPTLLVEDRPEGRYGLILLLPPAPDGDIGAGLPTETLFVVDVSGSMAGPSIVQAREALHAALGRLRPEDRFNLLKFNDGTAAFHDDFVYAEGPLLLAADAWIAGLEAGGGTDILPALLRAMELLGESRLRRAQRIVFVTDGAVSNEDDVLAAIVAELGDARLHTVGIGHAPNGWLMRKMAWHGRGLSTFVHDTAQVEDAIERFLGRIERPVLTDLELTWKGGTPHGLLPERLPDLYAGEPLYVSVRFDGPTAPERIALRGTTRSGVLERSTPVAVESAADSGIATRWARARVDAWTDALHEGADPEAVREAVVEIALAFDLVTRYTSLVAVEQTATALGPSRQARLDATLPLGGSDRRLRARVGLCLLGLGLALLAPLAGRHS